MAAFKFIRSIFEPTDDEDDVMPHVKSEIVHGLNQDFKGSIAKGFSSDLGVGLHAGFHVGFDSSLGASVKGSLGSQFVDLSNTSGLIRRKWSSSAPKWRKAAPGICLEGKCNNSSCDAYQKAVIINIGLRKFDYLQDITKDTSKCPMCSKYVEPITCAFNNCYWRWEGIKQPQRGSYEVSQS
ncbi:unnamed protein product [Rotaria sp. Silwood2]|nr:unnamed protein product [Rotaria sp. Silwood2]CAF3967770.1 unnamed protein product [Rotaria sp. Silwood2]